MGNTGLWQLFWWKLSKNKIMNSRYVLWVVAAMLMGATANAQVKKAPIKSVKGSTKKKTITEGEAKRLHEAQMMKEGHKGVRKAYKRTDMTLWENGETVAVEEEKAKPAKSVITAPSSQPTASPQPATVIAKAPPQPRFIESIVLERKEG